MSLLGFNLTYVESLLGSTTKVKKLDWGAGNYNQKSLDMDMEVQSLFVILCLKSMSIMLSVKF